MSTLVRLWSIGTLAFTASACAGGQSGTEMDPAPGCLASSSRVGPTEATPVGTAADLATEVGRAQSVPLRGFRAGSSASFDTILTLRASLDPATAMLSSGTDFNSPAWSCRTVLTVQAVLHFDTADGSFSDVFDGSFEVDTATNVGIFSAQLPLARHRGGGDLALYASNIQAPGLYVSTTLAPQASGRLVVDGDHLNSHPAPNAPLVAEWPEGDAVVGQGQDGS